MNYYPHHIGDFDRATRHLTRIERSIYRDLIEVYYDTEQALVLDVSALCRKIVARTEEEKSAVLAVLDEFFLETPSGWFHDRCEEELAEYRKRSDQASAAGRASAMARAERRRAALSGAPTDVQRSFNGRSTDAERECNGRGTARQLEANGASTGGQLLANSAPTNQEPRTKNQEPETKSKNKKPPAVADDELFPDVDLQVIADFKALRKTKKAAITLTAMKNIAGEAAKAGMSLEDALRVCCSRGWQGFNADWVTGKDTQAKSNIHVNHLDHSSSKRAMEESMARHGIAVLDSDDPIDF